MQLYLACNSNGGKRKFIFSVYSHIPVLSASSCFRVVLLIYLVDFSIHKSPQTFCLRAPAPRVGFEPTTLRLTAGCSTAELSRTIKSGNHLLSQAVTSQVPSAVYVLTRCSEWIPVFPIDASSPEILQMLLTPSKLNIRNKEILSQRYSSCKDKPSTY